MICASNNTGRGIQRLQAAHSHPDKPFYHLHMDFDIELRPCEHKKHAWCLLTCSQNKQQISFLANKMQKPCSKKPFQSGEFQISSALVLKQ